ncbi:methionine sulfoxide reductase [Planococcus plakortidis]|uniref:Methionine sulfoxide reductase n=1 Tax=Planococcus plakortidis TaxID=1038856 RepID=A0A1C7E9W9_9BACL|nr:DUF4357 domain-containing protein [Planococcus plakortidis]ANU20518.1 methionine sulfoxide reductase [Planococcus plakortidis]
MEKEFFVEVLEHPEYGEVYRFLEVDPQTGEEQAVDPFDSGMVRRYQEAPPELFYITSKRGADASGFYQGEQFIVQRGSKFAGTTTPKCPKRYLKLREELLLSGKLTPLGHQYLVMEDVEFASPLIAMGVAIGGWAKGAHDWKKI